MDTQNEDLKFRIEQLERHLNDLELRLNSDDMRLEILYAGRVSRGREVAVPADPADPETGEPGQGINVVRLETMMRSMLTHQGRHAADLKKAIGYLQELTHRRLA